MCIATLVKIDDALIYTFTRDEDPNRQFKTPIWINSKIFAPIDEIGGGTWIGYNQQSIFSLQNGGSRKHSRKLPYELSRGVVLKEVIIENSLKPLENIIGRHVEPFTILAIDTNTNSIKSAIYDEGESLKIQSFTSDRFINLSSTLYSIEIKEEINTAFNQLSPISADALMKFHHSYIIGGGLNPVNKPASTSITQFVISSRDKTCRFYNLLTKEDVFYTL